MTKTKKNKHKILINTCGVRNKNRVGAIEKIVDNVIDYLSDDFELTIFGQYDESNEKIKVIPYTKRMYLNKKNFLEYFYIIYNIYILIHGFLKIRNVATDIVVSTYQRNFFTSLLYSKLKKKPLIAWELDHDFWTPTWTITKKIYNFMNRKYTDYIIAISLEQKHRMIAKGIEQDKIKIIYNCTDTLKYHPSKQGSCDNYILYVAKFTERKNHLFLVKAFKDVTNTHPNLKLILVGPKSGKFSEKAKGSEYFKRCSDYIVSNNLNHNIIIHDYIEEDNLIELYQNASVFVFPSLEEGFGLSLLEAMACGCPCISNDIEPMSEVLGDTGILIDMKDPQLLTNKIVELLNNDKLSNKLAQRARERAVSSFSINNTCNTFYNLISEISYNYKH